MQGAGFGTWAAGLIIIYEPAPNPEPTGISHHVTIILKTVHAIKTIQEKEKYRHETKTEN